MKKNEIIRKHSEQHRLNRIGWLRAAVLGANDGIVSTASLVIGVASSKASHQEILISGIAALAAGAMSMAAGEYVSVSSQADTEKADLERESHELADNLSHETDELTQIYVERGLDRKLATEVAIQLMKHDLLGSHARDELGISAHTSARPFQAAAASALLFAAGALLPLTVVLFSTSGTELILSVALMSLASLLLLGYLAALAGGSGKIKSCVRVVIWGGFAMAITAGIGHFFA